MRVLFCIGFLLTNSVISVEKILDTGEWQNFKKRFDRYYGNDIEDQARFDIFSSNVARIEAHNARHQSYRQSINQFTDRTYAELQESILHSLPYPEDPSQFECPHKYETIVEDWQEFRDNLDWRNKRDNPLNIKATVGVKDQGDCGSCYAFSATATMEASLCIQGYFGCLTWEGLTEQQLLDCASYDTSVASKPWYEVSGCNGGWPSNAIQYAYRAGGVSCRGMYPYVSGNGSVYDNEMNVGECRYTASMSHGAPSKDVCGTINKYEWSDRTVQLMKSALFEKGPLSVGIYVGSGFMSYESGVYRLDNAATDCPSLEETGINHAVAVVGYGQEEIDGVLVPYWIVRNSWSSAWGDEGHIKVEMGGNLCGVETNVMFVEMRAGEHHH